MWLRCAWSTATNNNVLKDELKTRTINQADWRPDRLRFSGYHELKHDFFVSANKWYICWLSMLVLGCSLGDSFLRKVKVVYHVSSRFWQMVSKIQYSFISSRNRVYRLYKSYPFTEKRPRRPETGIKDGFEEMEREFPFETFRPGKQDYPIKCSVAPGNFPLQISCSIQFTFQPDFREW